MSLWSRLERRLGDLASELVLDEYRDQLNTARQLLSDGDPQAAIASLEALLKVKPDHGQAQILLGTARLAMHDAAGARSAFEQGVKLFHEGRGMELPGVAGTYWAAFNAITEFTTHKRGKSQDARVDSQWFGDSAKFARRALAVGLELAEAA